MIKKGKRCSAASSHGRVWRGGGEGSWGEEKGEGEGTRLKAVEKEGEGTCKEGRKERVGGGGAHLRRYYTTDPS